MTASIDHKGLAASRVFDILEISQQTMSHYIEQISQLPWAKQKFVIEMLDTVIQQAS